MKQRIITGILMFAVCVPLVSLGGMWFNIFGIIVVTGATYELLKAPNRKWPLLVHLLIYITMFYLTFFDTRNLVIDNRIFIGLIIALFAFNIFFEEVSYEDVTYLFTMTFLIGVAFRTLYYVRTCINLPTFLFVLFATFGCDTGAYFIGVTFGKHKLIPRLSPKKSIEGSIGGIVIGTIVAVTFAFFFEVKMSILATIVTALLLTITTQIGDLVFSSVKRHYGIKDFSNLLPGHGGLLDRLDSVSFNYVVFYLCLLFIL